MTVAVADTADGNRYQRAGHLDEVVRAIRAGELVVNPIAPVVLVSIDPRGRFTVVSEARATIERIVETHTFARAAEEELVEALEDPPPGHVILGVADHRGLTLAHVPRASIAPGGGRSASTRIGG